MHDRIIVAALIAIAGVTGCSNSSCTIPTGVPFTTQISINESTSNSCSADVVTGIEDAISGSTMTFDSAESCDDVELAFQFTGSSSATCTATGSVSFDNDFQTNSGSGNGGSGNGSIDVSCTDGTSCTEAIALILTEGD